jgi:CBS domain containing-hemolysin-like protein
MDSLTLAILVAVIVLLLAFSAFFSGTETAYTSASTARLKKMAEDGDKRARRALANMDNFDRLLTTVLVGNNVVNIASSTLTTFVLTEIYDAGTATIISTVLMITVLLLVGEITPKTLAKHHPEKMAMRNAGLMHGIIVALSPLTWIFLKVTNALTAAIGDDGKKQPTMTEAELGVMIDEIQEEGQLEKSESELIKSAMELDDKPVEAICVPRVDITAASVSVNAEVLKNIFVDSGFSRIPVYEGSIDRIVGAVFIKDFFAKYTSGKKFRVTDIIRPVKFVPRDASVAKVMSDLQKAKLNMAVVLDDYGGTVGIVTMEDLLEELVGEIWDENDTVDYPIRQEPDGSYVVDGAANIYDVFEKIGRSFEDSGYDSSTVGGYFGYRLQRIPRVGDSVLFGDVRMTVTATGGRRIKEVRFEIVPPAPELPPGEPEKERRNRGSSSYWRSRSPSSPGWMRPCR